MVNSAGFSDPFTAHCFGKQPRKPAVARLRTVTLKSGAYVEFFPYLN